MLNHTTHTQCKIYKMKKIKISHEVPFCLLDQSREFNDYDYCLPHLMDENEEYRNFFYESKKMGRYIVMDNSLHELGEAYNTERLMHWINEIKPDEFIVPDVWEDYTSSVRNAKLWSQVELPEGVMKVAVVQAKSIHEATLCTQAYKDFGYKKIAYSYGASYYNEVCPHPNVDFGKAIGRFMVISQLYKENILTKFDRVHLLGTAGVFEFPMYKNIKCIESIDTSNPIMAAIDNIKYTNGLHEKPISNMNSCSNISIDNINVNLVYHNVKMFKKFLEV
jgi:hypothetical protein